MAVAELLLATVTAFFLAGCAAPRPSSPAEEPAGPDRIIQRLAEARPRLSSAGRLALEAWVRPFADFSASRCGNRLWAGLVEASVPEGCAAAVSAACGKSLSALLSDAMDQWERRAPRGPSGPGDWQVWSATTTHFFIAAWEGTRAAGDVKLAAVTAEQALSADRELLGLKEEDLFLLPMLTWDREEGEPGPPRRTGGRIPLFLHPSCRQAGKLLSGDSRGNTLYLFQFRETKPYPRPASDVDWQVEIHVAYYNALSLAFVAHEVGHAVALTALSRPEDLPRDRPLKNEKDAENAARGTLPPRLRSGFLSEGFAQAVAMRTPLVKEAHYADYWGRMAAPAPGKSRPALSDLLKGEPEESDEHKAWLIDAGFFVDYLARRGGPKRLRQLLESPEADCAPALERVYGAALGELEREWRQGVKP